MAEIRKHNPRTGSDIGDQVRELLGETIRPVEPGSIPGPSGAGDEDDDLYDPFSQDDAPRSDQPVAFSFDAAGDAMIGTVPEGFISWVPDDDAE